jgi:hypothetical protein
MVSPQRAYVEYLDLMIFIVFDKTYCDFDAMLYAPLPQSVIPGFLADQAGEGKTIDVSSVLSYG